MKLNRYRAECRHCGQVVEPFEGQLIKAGGRKVAVVHRRCAKAHRLVAGMPTAIADPA